MEFKIESQVYLMFLSLFLFVLFILINPLDIFILDFLNKNTSYGFILIFLPPILAIGYHKYGIKEGETDDP